MLSIKESVPGTMYLWGLRLGKAQCVAFCRSGKRDVTLTARNQTGSFEITGTIESLQDFGTQLIAMTHQWIIDHGRDDLLEDFEQEIRERMPVYGDGD